VEASGGGVGSTKLELASCPGYDRAVEIIGRRWAGAVVRVMLSGASRFSEIRSAIPGITDRVLSHHLKDLEAIGILTTPPETAGPRCLRPPLNALFRQPVLDSHGSPVVDLGAVYDQHMRHEFVESLAQALMASTAAPNAQLSFWGHPLASLLLFEDLALAMAG
jgi:DNA-binding transcriptional ArsR family regulator